MGFLCIIRTIRLWIDYLVDFFFSLYYKNAGELVPPVKQRYVSLSATQMARKLQERVVTCEELIQSHVSRIKEVNKIINAVVDERFEDALAEARKIDEGLASGVITPEAWKDKPFLGVPFTSKESTHCKGMKISFGLIPRRNVKAQEDADVVKLMKDAGAILLAVTNVPQLNLWFETHNPVYGLTKNPYNTTRNVGGSSGGEAAIIAACGSPIGVGTDIGGSIRIPANMCGLFGHKASPELTPTKGLTYRDGSEPKDTMVATGPLVRYAEDLIPGLKAMIGPAHKRLDLDAEVNVKKLKYYYVLDSGDILMSTPRPEVVNALKKAVNYFSEIASTEQVSFPQTKHTIKLYKYWLSLETNNFSKDITARESQASFFPELMKYFTGNSNLSFPALLVLLNNILPNVKEEWAKKMTEELKSALLDKLGDDGVLLYLSAPMAAQCHHANYFRPYNLSNFALFNVLRMPVTQVPMGLSPDGLPVGIQVVAPPYKDHLTIAVAKELEKGFGGYVTPFSTEGGD